VENQIDTTTIEDPPQWDHKQNRPKKPQIECNLCGKVFKPQNKFERFCQNCKEEAEDYLLYDDSSVFY